MNRKKVESGMISSVGYDETTRTLEVEFKSGGVYRYAGVTPEVHKNLMGAASVGQFFSAHVKGSYNYEKVAQQGSKKSAAKAKAQGSPADAGHR